jgi:hypothetical protein
MPFCSLNISVNSVYSVAIIFSVSLSYVRWYAVSGP